MSDQDKLETTIRKGRAARIILDDPAVNEVMAELEERAISDATVAAMMNKDSEAAQNLRTATLLTKVRARLQTMVANGREAEREVERLNGR